MGLLMVIASVALGSITLAENQQANTYARTISISQAQLTAEAVTKAIRNANYPYSATDTPIIEASPYELYFYQGSYSSEGTNQLAVIWLANSTSATISSGSNFEGSSSAPSCIVASPCFLMENIYSYAPTSPPSYPPSYPPSGLTPGPQKVLGSGIVFPGSTNPCGSALSSGGSHLCTSGSGIFQFYDGSLNPATDLSNLLTIGVTLQAQYQVDKPLVSVTSYVQIRNLSSGS